MIKENDLRVGNYVIDKMMLYSGIKEEFIKVSIKDLIHSSLLKPIVLTDKIIQEIGFANLEQTENNGNSFIYDHVVICHLGDVFLVKFDIEMNYIKEIKYVHELQNFYYETRGKELEFKL